MRLYSPSLDRVHSLQEPTETTYAEQSSKPCVFCVCIRSTLPLYGRVTVSDSGNILYLYQAVRDIYKSASMQTYIHAMQVSTHDSFLQASPLTHQSSSPTLNPTTGNEEELAQAGKQASASLIEKRAREHPSSSLAHIPPTITHLLQHTYQQECSAELYPSSPSPSFHHHSIFPTRLGISPSQCCCAVSCNIKL